MQRPAGGGWSGADTLSSRNVSRCDYGLLKGAPKSSRHQDDFQIKGVRSQLQSACGNLFMSLLQAINNAFWALRAGLGICSDRILSQLEEKGFSPVLQATASESPSLANQHVLLGINTGPARLRPRNHCFKALKSIPGSEELITLETPTVLPVPAFPEGAASHRPAIIATFSISFKSLRVFT